MAKVEIGQWIQPRGREKIGPSIKGSLEIVVDPQAAYSRYLTQEEFTKDYNRLLSIDPSSLVFLIGPMTGRRDPYTLQIDEIAQARIASVERFFGEYGLIVEHCFGRQNLGRWGVSSEQASVLDGTALDRASTIVGLPWASTSVNTFREIKRTISTGKSLVLFYEEPEENDFKDRVIQLILSAPKYYPPSALIPIRGATDLAEPLGKLFL